MACAIDELDVLGLIKQFKTIQQNFDNKYLAKHSCIDSTSLPARVLSPIMGS